MYCQLFNINMFLWKNCKRQGERKQRQNAFMSKGVNYIKRTYSGDEALWSQMSRSSETDGFQYNLWESPLQCIATVWLQKIIRSPARAFLLKRKRELWRKDNFLQFIKGLYSEFTFTREILRPRTSEVLRCLNGNYMILWIWVSVTMVTETIANAHRYIGLISSRVAFQVLCFCLEMTLEEDVNLKSLQSAYKIQRAYINLFMHFFTQHRHPSKLDKSSTAVCTSPCCGEKPQEWSLEDSWPPFICHLFFMWCDIPLQQYSRGSAF